MTSKREESTAWAPFDVPLIIYWGAQTERSLHHFAIGHETHAVSSDPSLWCPEARVSEGLITHWANSTMIERR